MEDNGSDFCVWFTTLGDRGYTRKICIEGVLKKNERKKLRKARVKRAFGDENFKNV